LYPHSSFSTGINLAIDHARRRDRYPAADSMINISLPLILLEYIEASNRGILKSRIYDAGRGLSLAETCIKSRHSRENGNPERYS
jgi:hypothetical protein